MQPENSPKIRLNLIPFLSLIGIGAAVYLTQLYHSLQDGTAGFKSLCNLGKGMNCSSVALSKWAELAPGFPLSSFVAGWFLAILIIGLLARLDGWKKTAIHAGVLMTGFSSLYSLILLIVMLFVIHNVCAFCLVIDFVNFALFAIFWSIYSKKGPLWGGIDSSKRGAIAGIIGVSIFIFVVVTKPMSGEGPSTSDIQYAVNQILERAPDTLTIDDQVQSMGPANAPITIVEFSDFECPFCKRGAGILHMLQERYPNDIRIVFKNFPLDMSCNRIIDHPMHKNSCALAKIALCAQAKGKFQGVYEKAFDEQETLKPETVLTVGESLGLSEAELKTCMESEATKAALNRDIEEGIRLKVEATPTMFVNGKKIETLLPIEGWEKIIQALKK